MIVLTVVLITAAAVYISLRQPRLYQSTADVFLNTQNLAASLSSIQPVYVDPQRAAETQANLARVPAVAARALRAVGLGNRAPGALLAESSVTPSSSADILSFSVTDRNRLLAPRLVTAYAKAYTDYRRELDTSSLIQARQEIERRITELQASGDRQSDIYNSLVEKDQQLRTAELLQRSNAALVRPSQGAVQIQPKPERNGILAGVLGLMVGIALAFVRDALNTRVRSAAEVHERLGLPMLGRVPEPARRRRGRPRLTMLDEPQAQEAEAYRILATNLDFVNLDRGASTIMITSASRGDGKSTTIANLAVAFARAGRRVALVDLDLRRPSIGSFFGLEDEVGVTHVALERAALDNVLVRVPLEAEPGLRMSANGAGPGSLDVLPSGPLPPNPAEFASSHVLTDILGRLAERKDLVLIDAPPILQVSDTMTLSAKVDAIVAVARLPDIRRGALDELRRVLDAAPVIKLGVIVTGASGEEDYGYGYGYGYGYDSESRKERGRVR